jgi:hypothetical protein
MIIYMTDEQAKKLGEFLITKHVSRTAIVSIVFVS